MANANALHYALAVHGAPGARVHLRARGLPLGWVATFCTPAFCAPFRYEFTLDRRGNGRLEFSAIRVQADAPHRARVRIEADGAQAVSLVLRSRSDTP